VKNEFDFIQNIKKKFRLDKVGDDCAVLPKDGSTDLVITTDMLVEDIDFRVSAAKPETIGHKSLAVSLSDIAAMGALPKWALLSIALEEKLWKTDFLDRFYLGWHTLAQQYGVELVGGDVSRSPDKLVIDSVVGGEVNAGTAVLRSGARPGDLIFVTGSLGGAAGGLRLIERGTPLPTDDERHRSLMKRQLCPQPQIENGLFLREHDLATAMIDISDGLTGDLAHICNASSVGAILEIDAIPIDPNFSALALNDNETLDLTLGGGEDFELLFTIKESNKDRIVGKDFSCIGEITSNAGVIQARRGAHLETLKVVGYRHF